MQIAMPASTSAPLPPLCLLHLFSTPAETEFCLSKHGERDYCAIDAPGARRWVAAGRSGTPQEVSLMTLVAGSSCDEGDL